MLPWRWAETRLKRSHNYWVVTVRKNGAPHAMPVWGVWVDRNFYFSTGKLSVKAKNLAANAACIVCTENAAEAVIVEGEARIVRSPAILRRVGTPYARKYKPWRLDSALGPVFAVRPKAVFAMWEKQFAGKATRWQF